MNVIKNILSVVIMLSTVGLFGQYQVRGIVTDQSEKEVLPGVFIYLPAAKKGATSDYNGAYVIDDLKKGSYLIEASVYGFKSVSIKIDIDKDTIVNLALTPSATELSEIVVTGVTRATEMKRNPVIVATVDGNKLRQSNATNLIAALKEIPGVSQVTTGPNISKPVIRGLGFNRLITLNNGIKQEGQQWGDEHGIEIDQYAIDRAEVIKGPGSLLYGSDGIAGVLNFLSPKAQPEGTIKTQILSNYQSNNNLLGYSVSNTGNKNGIQWTGRFSNKYAGNYNNRYDGDVYNSGFHEYNGNLMLGVSKNWGNWTLSVNSYNTKLGIIEGERDADGKFVFEDRNGNEVSATKNDLKGYSIGVPYQWVNHLGVASNNYIILNRGTINADIGFQSNRRREFEDAEDPDEAELDLLLNTFNYNLRYNFDKINGWEISTGVSGMFQKNKNQGEEFLIPDYNLFDIGAFVYTQKPMGELTLAGGLRFDNRNVKGAELYLDEDEMPTTNPDSHSELKFAGFTKNFSGLSGSIGVSYQLSHASTLKFNFSNGFRAPNIAELASNGKHEGTFRYEIGNSNLKSEFSHQLDLAYTLNDEHITFEISPFVNFISNYIFLQKLKDSNGNDIFPDPEDPSPAFQYTSGNATLWGGEIYIDIHPHPLDWLHIENAFSYVRGTQNNATDEAKNLPFIPAPHYRGGIMAQFKNVSKTVSDFYVKFYIDHYFAQNKVYRAYDTETATPAYTLLSFGTGASFDWFDKTDFLSLYLGIENLTNTTYQNHLSRLKYAPENPATGRTGVFDMGRNINLKMILNF